MSKSSDASSSRVTIWRCNPTTDCIWSLVTNLLICTVHWFFYNQLNNLCKQDSAPRRTHDSDEFDDAFKIHTHRQFSQLRFKLTYSVFSQRCDNRLDWESFSVQTNLFCDSIHSNEQSSCRHRPHHQQHFRLILTLNTLWLKRSTWRARSNAAQHSSIFFWTASIFSHRQVCVEITLH